MSTPIDNFCPSWPNYTLVINNGSTNQALTQNTPPSGSPMVDVEIMNQTNGMVFAKWGKGAQVATANDYAVPPGIDKIVRMQSGYDNIAVYGTGTGNTYVSIGSGS